jgi:hypothetical protein
MLKHNNPGFLGLLLGLFLLPAFGFAQNGDGWVFKNEKDGVKVYYKKTSDVHEIKMVTSMKASLSGIVQLLNEVENYASWGYKISEARLLRRTSDKEFYYYSKIDFPWPLSDRDIIVQAKVEQDSVTKRVTSTSHSKPNYLPENKDVVRIKTTTTRWTVVPGTGGWCYIEYYIYSDPAGNIPDWLVNMAIDVGPLETLSRMRNMLQQPKYRTAKLAYIKE